MITLSLKTLAEISQRVRQACRRGNQDFVGASQAVWKREYHKRSRKEKRFHMGMSQSSSADC
jgi:hypothetical protein